MKVIQLIFLIILIISISCNSEKGYKYVYYDNGNLQYKYEYFDSDDTTSYLLYTYLKDTNICTGKYIVYDNMCNGNAYTYYEDGSIKELARYKRNKKNGILRGFTQSGDLYKIKLYLNDTSCLEYEYYVHDSLKTELLVYNYLIQETKTKSEIGYIEFDSTGAIIEERSALHHIVAKDTLEPWEDYCFDLKLHGLPSGGKLTLYLGRFDLDLNLLDTAYVFSSTKENYQIKECITPNNVGYNLLLGKYYWFKEEKIGDSLVVDTIISPIFKDYYLK